MNRFLTLFLLAIGIASAGAQSITSSAASNQLAADYKLNVLAASTANIDLTEIVHNSTAIDGVTITAAGQRFLAKNQSTSSQNGIYVSAASGEAAVRASDANTWAELPGALVVASSGTTNNGKAFVNTSALTGTLGSTSVTWVENGVENIVYLFGVSGQSNAYGAGGSTGGAPTPPNLALQWTTGGGVAALALTAGTSGGETFGTSAVPQFALNYQAMTGRRACFVSGSMVDGAAMASGADGGPGDFDAAGELRAAVVSRYLSAEAALQAAGYTVIRAGIIWVQGEQDAEKIRDATITESTFKSALTTFIAYCRTNLGAALPFYLVRTGPRISVAETGIKAVQGAQEEVALADPSVVIVARETADFSALSMLADTVHYNQTGQNRVGMRLAQAAAGQDTNAAYRDYVESGLVAASAITLTTATGANVTSISLPAGTWNVNGHISHNASGATATVLRASSNTTSATNASNDYDIGFLDPNWVTASSKNSTVVAPTRRYVLTSRTTIYLVANATFSAGTVIAWGKISARRE